MLTEYFAPPSRLSPNGPVPRSFAERFWSHVNKTDGEGCWLWTGATTVKGYGHISAGRTSGKTILAHRAAWEMAGRGDIPDGLFVCHTCDTPACVRSEHLFLGTNADNMADCVTKGRMNTGDRHWARRMPERLLRGEAWRDAHPITMGRRLC